VRIGLDILAPLSHIKQPLKYVEHHHERWDGVGYPLKKSVANDKREKIKVNCNIQT